MLYVTFHVIFLISIIRVFYGEHLIKYLKVKLNIIEKKNILKYIGIRTPNTIFIFIAYKIF